MNKRPDLLERPVRALTQASALDGPARTILGAVSRLLPPGPLKDAVSGTGLGHPLHPVLTDVPIGFWTSAALLDLIGGKRSRPAARRLIGAGIAAALPTALAGASDLADVEDREIRRLGLVHGVANAFALSLYMMSYARRREGGGRFYSTLGLAALTAGGYLGGHLSYRAAIGVSRTAFQPRIEEWTVALSSGELVADEPKRVTVKGNEIMLVRSLGRVHALANRCTHRGGPLYKGRFEDDCVVCPWHLSKFSLEDGSIVRGPASAPQPVYDIRDKDGNIEVRSAATG